MQDSDRSRCDVKEASLFHSCLFQQRYGRSQEAQCRCDKDAFADEKSGRYTYRTKEESHRRPSCRRVWSGIIFIAGSEQPDSVCIADLECHSAFQNHADLQVGILVQSLTICNSAIDPVQPNKKETSNGSQREETVSQSKNHKIHTVPSRQDSIHRQAIGALSDPNTDKPPCQQTIFKSISQMSSSFNMISALFILVVACMSTLSSTVDAFRTVPNVGVSSVRPPERVHPHQLSMVQSIPTKSFRFPQIPNNESFQSPAPVVPAPIPTNFGSASRQMVRAIRKELRETYNLLESNLLAHMLIGMIGCVIPSMVAMSQLNGAMSVGQYTGILAKSLVWFFGYGYVLDIENQVHGVEEDKLNPQPAKQKRPLVTGAWTIAGAQKRAWISRVAYTSVSALVGGVPLTLCALVWIATCKFLYAVKPCNFITKNYISMTVGSYSMVMGAWIMAGGPTNFTTTWPFLCSAAWVGLSMDVQDIRDEAGDRATGRLTMPVLIGVENARKLWAVEFGIFPAIASYVMRSRLSISDAVIGVGVIGLIIQSLLATNKHDDNILHRNYILFLYLVTGRAAFWVLNGMDSI